MSYLSQPSKFLATSSYKILSYGIPAFQSSDGFRTCPNAGKCSVGCYASQGRYSFGNVKAAYEKRLKLSLSERFVHVITDEILQVSERQEKLAIRIHDSGDFYSMKYALKWFEVAKECKSVRFYAYTKEVALMKHLSRKLSLPANFTLIYSYGGRNDRLINQENDRHARVFDNIEALRLANYADACKDDSVAFLSDNHRIGLIYHGAKSKRWTA